MSKLTKAEAIALLRHADFCPYRSEFLRGYLPGDEGFPAAVEQALRKFPAKRSKKPSKRIVLLSQIEFSAASEGATDDSLGADLEFLERQLKRLAKRRGLTLKIDGEVIS